MHPRTGLDRLLDADDASGAPYRDLALGLVTNDAALSSGWRRARTELLGAGYRIERLFSPEHGLSAQGRDGQAQGDAVDPATGLEIVSLYGEKFAPAATDLDGLDAVLLDLPDVGTRFYTYLWTMTHVAEACASVGLPLVVLDRPNPLGGDLDAVEGPMLEPSCSSFIGRWPIPVRHGLTFGELAILWRTERFPGLDLRVIEMAGWERNILAAGSGAPWMPTSPAMPSAETALLYPGMGLIEGVALSDGRGTALPFRLVGAPWVDGGRLAEALSSERERGIAAVPYAFTPSADKYDGERCEGVLLTVLDPAAVRPVASGLRLLGTVASLWPDRFTPHAYRTAANPGGAAHLDRMLGLPGAFDRIRDGSLGEKELAVPDWAEQVAGVLLY